MGIFDFIYRGICRAPLEQNETYKQTLINKEAELSKLQDMVNKDQTTYELELSSLRQLNSQLTADRDICLKEKTAIAQKLSDLENLKQRIPSETQTLINLYDSKYPPATISYGGRYWGTNPANGYSLDVRVFAQAGINSFDLYNHVKNHAAFVDDIMKANPNMTFHQACDEAVLRIAKGTPLNYYYDNNLYNSDEYWAFSFETFHIQKGDCDDWAHLRHVLYSIAGVPQGLIRVVCGMTKDNKFGHATNYYLASDGKWYHINSTSNIFSRSDWKDKDDPNDTIGIGSVWFSYNADNSWHVFKTDAAKDSYYGNKLGLSKYIKIKPFW